MKEPLDYEKPEKEEGKGDRVIFILWLFLCVIFGAMISHLTKIQPL